MKVEMVDSESICIQEMPINAQSEEGGRRVSRAELIARLPDRTDKGEPEITTDEMIAALETYTGGVHFAARSLGCSAQSIYRRSWTDPRLKEVLMSYRGMLIDTAEKGLRNAVEREDAWAIQFTLKTIGKRRGYVERVETRNRTQLKGAMVSFLAPPQLSGLLGASPEAISGAEPTADMPQLPPADDKRI